MNNEKQSKIEYIPGNKYTADCGIEFIYDPAGNKEKPYLLNNGIRINHEPTKKDTCTNNLKPLNAENYPNRTNIAQELGSKGGAVAAENRRKKKSAAETIQMLLSLPATKTELKELDPAVLQNLTDEEKKNLDQQFLIYARALELAKAGSKDHLIILRDTGGDKPTDKVQQDVNIMTDADRALMDKISKRLSTNGQE